MRMQSVLKDKRVLVTGSSRGIGRALAVGFASCGARVAVHGVHPGAALEQTCEQIAALGGTSLAVCGDLADPRAADTLMDAVEEAWGGVDILICNVSIQIRRPWLEISQEEMLVQTQVNLFSTVRLMQRAVPYMRAQNWGRILTIGSVQQNKPHPDMLLYAANKCGVYSVVRNLALQLAPEHITVNNLAVGTIYTDRNEAVLADAAYLRQVESSIPTGFIGQPEDCVGAALLLADEAGRYITGENIHIDGGKFI